VKFAKKAGIFVSCTSHGEVRLWELGKGMEDSCRLLGTLNTNDWNTKDITKYLTKRGKLD